jgi:hypothetical protein
MVSEFVTDLDCGWSLRRGRRGGAQSPPGDVVPTQTVGL